MSDERTIPSFTDRLWSEEVGTADPTANFDAPPVLSYTFGGRRTLVSNVNTTLYAGQPPVDPYVTVSAASAQRQRVQGSIATVNPPASVDVSSAQAQRARARLLGAVQGALVDMQVETAQARQSLGASATVTGQASGGSGGSASAAPIAIGAQIAPMSIENTAGTPANSQAFTLGHAFLRGHLPSTNAAVTLKQADGSTIPAQLIVKALHADGSVRHAIISGVLPSIAGLSTLPLSIVRAAGPDTSTPQVGLPATLPSARLVVGGSVYTAAPTAATPHTTWFSGPVASDFIFNMPFVDGAGNPHPVLTAQFSVRAYSNGQVRVDAVVEHCKAYASTTDVTYDAMLSMGGTTMYSITGLTHYPAARWKRTFWSGAAPTLHVRHDVDYLIDSRQVPNYDRSTVFSESLLAGYASELATAKFNPMQFGRFQSYMGTTGGRPEIGLLPDTYATALLTMDKRATDLMLASADVANSWSGCRRDDSNGPGAGLPLSIINFPYASILGNFGDCVNPRTGKNEHLPDLTTVSKSSIDTSHQPGAFYLPYLVTGDLFYLEGLQFWACFNNYQYNPYYRGFDQGLHYGDQVRGQGWCLRTLAEALAITPDDHPLKGSFNYWWEANLTWFNNRYIHAVDNVLGIITNGYALGYVINNGGANGVAPWMNDFFAQSLGHAVELLDHAGAKALLTFVSKFAVDRLASPGACPQEAAIYALGVRATENSPFFTTLADCMAFTVPDHVAYACNSPQRLALSTFPLKPGDIDGYPNETSGYPSNYQPALAAAVDIGYPNSATAWATFMARPTKPDYGPEPQFAVVARAAKVATAVVTRNPLVQPFTSTSIWNMPIGTGAVYTPAGIDPNPANNQYAYMPGADGEHIILTPTAPLTDIRYSSAGWSGADRCASGGAVLVSVPMPASYLVPMSNRNEGAAILMPDGRTLVQVQPIARCTAGSYATALVKEANVDLYGDGITGAHGGSGLSSIGGSIRMGELRPGQTGPKHALKVNVYARQALFKATTRAQAFRWPAITCDSYAVGTYGVDSNNSNVDMKMGALLAIPSTVDLTTLGLTTEPARQLAWTLQHYGAYIVDDTGTPGFDFSVEDGPDGSKAAEFQADYGFAMAQRVGTQTAWVKDVQKLVAALYVVTNNSATAVGGGGSPLQPLAPPLP